MGLKQSRRAPDLFITGVQLDDMEELEHLEPFVKTRLPILVVTSRPDARTFRMLRALRYDGIYNLVAEGMENLPTALREVTQGRPYGLWEEPMTQIAQGGGEP